MSDSKLTTTNDQSSHFVHVNVTCKNMYVWCKIKKPDQGTQIRAGRETSTSTIIAYNKNLFIAIQYILTKTLKFPVV